MYIINNSTFYLVAQMLSQPRPAGGAVIDDWLFGGEDGVPLRGVFFVASVDDQPTHFDQAVPVVLVEVGRSVLIPAETHRLRLNSESA